MEALEHTLSYLLPALIERLATRPAAPPRPLLSSQSSTSSYQALPPPLLPLRVIILDSLAALIRVSFPTTGAGLTLRSAAFASLADKLKSLAALYNLAIVVVNQVSDLFNDPWGTGDSWSRAEAEAARQAEEEEEEEAIELAGLVDGDGKALNGNRKRKMVGGRMVGADDIPGGKVSLSFPDQAKWFNGSSPSFGKEASLGLTWSNCIDTRIMLSRTHRYRLVDPPPSSNGVGSESGQTVPRKELIRRMHLVFGSGARGGGRVDYVVGAGEVRGLRDVVRAVGEGRERKRAKREEGDEADGGFGAERVEGDEDEEFGDVGWMTQIPEQEWTQLGD
jgi:hypothetical protein